MPDASRSSVGTQAAFGARNARVMMARQWGYRALRVSGTRFTKGFPDYFEFAPEVRDEREFADLCARVSCYWPGVPQPLYLPGPRFALRPELVPHFDPALVRDPGFVHERPPGTGHLMVHRLTPSSMAHVLSSKVPASVVDTRLHARCEDQYFVVRNSTTWPTYAPVEEALERLRRVAGAGRTAFILATGPSALTVDVGELEADVRITCNSAVRDLDRIKAFRPNIIACTDPVFHFGPSRYAAEFRRDLVRAAEAVDALVLCGDSFPGAMLDLHPELKERLVVVPHQDGGPYRLPSARNPTLRHCGNVLTTLMLPIAMLLAEDVRIAGADGRQPSENYFWKHNPALQYSDELMQTVFDGHPSFFRDKDYADYYEMFTEDVEQLIRLGEGLGKRVSAASPSWIPALRARGATEPASAVA